MTTEEAKRLAKHAVIAWRDRVLALRDWTAQTWADKAGISATTLTRSMAITHPSTVKLETLEVLARTAKVPSVLDFLQGQAFSVAALRPVLAEVLPLARKGRWTEQDIEHLASALEYGLALTPSDPTIQASLDGYGAVAREAANRFREISAES
ncbi:hypothetical protein [Novosphingobium colocasiae]|uniref:hypothetical protein n=1 Tax=Novosphingobium colocasiae TaxID=1256513 RepID=UPI0035ADCF18